MYELITRHSILWHSIFPMVHAFPMVNTLWRMAFSHIWRINKLITKAYFLSMLTEKLSLATRVSVLQNYKTEWENYRTTHFDLKIVELNFFSFPFLFFVFLLNLNVNSLAYFFHLLALQIRNQFYKKKMYNLQIEHSKS